MTKHCIMTAVQKSCIHASAVAVFVEWWIVVFVDIVSFHRGRCLSFDLALIDHSKTALFLKIIHLTFIISWNQRI